MVGSPQQSTTELLAFAAAQVIPAPGCRPWDYGWSVPGYRHSPDAAISGPSGPVTFRRDGLLAWEDAVTALLKERSIRDRWSAGELWGIVASITVAASLSKERTSFLDKKVQALRSCGPALNVVLIANVTWNRPSLALDDVVVGYAKQEFLDLVNLVAGSRNSIDQATGGGWLRDSVQSRLRAEDDPVPVAFACWTVGQWQLADKETDRRLQDVVNLCLLLERDLKAHRVHRRGDANRPGVRGLTLDRGAIERGVIDSAHLELGSTPLIVRDLFADRCGASWFGTEPLPLGDLLDQEYLRDAVEACLGDDPVSARIRVASRWYAEAHYTLASDDAALALGVAMDALLGGQRVLPGSAMADRFALLATDPHERRERARNYLDLYAVRSSVAHGGRSRRLDQGDFLERYQTAVRWAAWRTIALRDAFAPPTEKDIDELFDELRWGSRVWNEG